MFEKYDGVRAFWNPLKLAFFSRFGNMLMMPQHIVESMPSDTFLDGELWYVSSHLCLIPCGHVYHFRFGRNAFDDAVKIALKRKESVDWNKFRYMVFDIPNHKGTYKERYSILGNISHYINYI